MPEEVRPAITPASPASLAQSAPEASFSPSRRGVLHRALRVAANETEGLHLRLRLIGLLIAVLPHFAFNRLRTRLYRWCGVPIGARSLILGGMELAGPGRIQERFRVGEDSQITSPLYADVSSPITIGNRVFIGHHAVLITTDHAIGPPHQRCGSWKSAPIVIEDGAWLGARVTILPGVRIGRGAVVAAGALVTRDAPPNTLVGGVPAKVLRELDTDETL